MTEVRPQSSPSNPSNGAARSAAESLELALGDLRAARAREPFPSPALRKQWLRALLEMSRQCSDRLAAAVSEDFGHRSVHETKLGESWLPVSHLEYLLANFEAWLEPEPKGVTWPFWFGRAEVRVQPKGVVGIISPWNYPFLLPVEQLAGALAAGNRVILKLSEHVPRTSALLAEELGRRLPRDVLRVFTGGEDEGRALCELPLDHLLFTGSTEVGRLVYQSAARHLVPVTLELGGKSPAILHPSFSVERFARSVVFGKAYSAGQSCVAPDYALVPRGALEAVERAITERFAARFPTLANNPDYSSLAGRARKERIIRLIDEAVALGARAVPLNPAREDLGDGWKLPLTLLFDCPDRARVMQEEIFGPVLPVVAYDELDEAIHYVNQRPRPLALYYFDEDARRVDHVLERTVSGGVTINDTMLHFLCDALPRGTTGASGIGAYHGRMSFDAFSHQRSVFRQSRLNGLELLMPPYRRSVEWLLRWLIGR